MSFLKGNQTEIVSDILKRSCIDFERLLRIGDHEFCAHFLEAAEPGQLTFGIVEAFSDDIHAHRFSGDFFLEE
jgi:hypothetical protein